MVALSFRCETHRRIFEVAVSNARIYDRGSKYDYVFIGPARRCLGWCVMPAQGSRKRTFGWKRAIGRQHLCHACEVDVVHVECFFSTRVSGGRVMVRHPYTVGLLCSETRLKTFLGAWRARFVGLLQTCYVWREEYSVLYDTVTDRITRWVPRPRPVWEGHDLPGWVATEVKCT